MNLLVHFWPVAEIQVSEPEPVTFDQEVLIDDILITRQGSIPPPPPRPILPEPVPDDVVFEDPIELDDELDIDLPDLPEGQGRGTGGEEAAIVSEPEVRPSVVRIVEPTISDLPAELRGRIEVVVNFLVNQDGTVDEVHITEIRRYRDVSRDEYEVLPFIRHGVMGAVIDAALNWRFRAARDDGRTVRTWTTATFNF